MPENNSHIVQIQDLYYERYTKSIFSNLSLQIARGAVTAIMGPSGTGKTSLLRLIGGQIKPRQGDVLFDEIKINQLSRRELRRLRQERMGMLFQAGALFTDMNVFDNVAFLLREHTNLSPQMVRDLVLMKLQAVGLRGAANLMVNELSGGMARRVALARAIMLDPELMMYDEPFTGQDPINRGILIKLIRELNDALGMTSIIVSHDVNEVAAVADYVYVIADGSVIGQGSPQEIMQTSSPKVRQFVQGLPDGPVPFAYPASDYSKELGV